MRLTQLLKDYGGGSMPTVWYGRRASLLVILTLLSFTTMTTPAGATTCTLADHIRSANTNTSVGGCPTGTSHDIIAFTEDITLDAALPPITGTITIEGNGHTISGDHRFRIFDVSGGRLAISNLLVTNGKAASEEYGGAIRMRAGAQVRLMQVTFSHNSAYQGGAIAASGRGARLDVQDSSFIRNSSQAQGGAILLEDGRADIALSSFTRNVSRDIGGAMVVRAGEAQITNSTFHHNQSGAYSGDIHTLLGGDVTLTHATITSGAAFSALGGATKRQGGNIRMRNSIIWKNHNGDDCANGLDQSDGNLSKDGSCGIVPSGDPLLGALTGAPAWRPLLDGSPAIDSAASEFCLERDQRGTPRPSGAGCDIGAIESIRAKPAALPIEPPPPCPLALQIVAANTDAPAGGCPAGSGHDVITLTEDIELQAALPAVTSDITIEGEGFTISGRGRYRIFRVQRGKLTLNNMTLTRGIGSGSNSGGGAVRLEAAGQLEANHVVFSDNRAASGGAIDTYSNGVSLIVNHSQFIDNKANSGGAISMNGGGIARVSHSSFVANHGGFFGGGAINSWSGAVTVANSTFVNNEARQGGAILVGGRDWPDALPVTLTHVTMLNNRASFGKGIFIEKDEYSDVALRLRNSIAIGELTSEVCDNMKQNIGNLIADGACSPRLSGDPMLAEPGDWPAYLEPLPGSPAIGAADARFCTQTDQVGRPRAIVGNCDIGAVEAVSVRQAVSDCVVTTTHGLYFRNGPAGNVIGSVPQNATLPATARTARWFEVEHEGRSGWISADYVEKAGDCDLE